MFLTYGPASLAGLPCPGNLVSSPAVTSKPSLFKEQKIKQDDQALLRSLGDFDELLRKEEERIKTQNQGAGDEAEKGLQAGKEGLGSTKAASGQTQEEQGSGSLGSMAHKESRQGEQMSAEAEGRKQQANSGTKIRGAQVPSASAHGPSTLSGDDDIVARQLREAAEKETDPELKKRLWEEYRKYKEGRR